MKLLLSLIKPLFQAVWLLVATLAQLTFRILFGSK
jgi:hypothetical protein